MNMRSRMGYMTKYHFHKLKICAHKTPAQVLQGNLQTKEPAKMLKDLPVVAEGAGRAKGRNGRHGEGVGP